MLLFDIGANIGKWAIANQSGNQIICIEASPSTFQTLVRETNSYSNIACINYAVSPSDEPEVEFFESDADTLSTLDPTWVTSTTSRFYSQYKITGSIRVPSITVDKLVDFYGTPDILKLDVEGAENIVLKSLTRKLKTLCFEWASEWDTQAKECIDHVVSLGYSNFYLQFGDEYTFRPSEYPLTSESLWSKFQTTVPRQDWGMIWCI